MNCPCCQRGNPTVVLERHGVPVHQNQVYHKAVDAISAGCGTVRLVHCDSCGHVWNAAFDPERLSYDHEYDNRQDTSSAFSAYLDGLAAGLAKHLDASKSVVEVGCGQGRFLRRLCAFSGASGVGFDPAYRGPDQLDGARFIPTFYGPAQADVPADLVVCRHVIEHVEHPMQLLGSVRAALRARPETQVFFECPDLCWILENDVVWDVFYEHVHYFTPGSLEALFHRAGFRDVVIERAFGGQYLWLTARPGEPSAPPLEAIDVGAVHRWAGRLRAEQDRWAVYLEALAAYGPVLIWGAGAKGVTLAHLVDPDGHRIIGLVDVNPSKQGAFVPGTGHPVLAPSVLRRLPSAQVVVVNPNYVDEIRSLAQRAGLPVTVHPPEVPCASPSMTKLAS